MTELDGKVAIVTGASRGIGRAVALHLAASGATVVVKYRTHGDAAAAVVAAIEQAGGTAVAIAADISCSAQTDALFAETLDRFGQLDILVANAGRSVFAPLVEVTEQEFDRTFAVNAKGTFLCLRQAASVISDHGRIVCVSTIGTVLNLPGGAIYFASKAAIEQFCRILALELAPRGVTVNIVSPGFTDTEMLDVTGIREPAALEKIIGMTPLARLGQPPEIAAAIGFLVGPQAGWITRQNLPADGGIISR